MPKLKRGYYETDYGGEAYVSGPNAKTAYDPDSAERIPIEMVNPDKFVRPLHKGEYPTSNR
jgi:hypothetical protein